MMKKSLLSHLVTLAVFSLSLVARADETKEVELEIRGMT